MSAFIRVTLLAGLLSAAPFTAASAAAILVTTADDEFLTDGDCSLREALFSANNNTLVDTCNIGQSGQDSITILVSDPIVLSQPLAITETVTIGGAGMDITTVSGGGTTRVFEIDVTGGGENVLIQDMTIEDGLTGSLDGGAGLLVRCVATLRMEDVRLRNHEVNAVGAPGGAIRMEPQSGCDSRLEIDRSIVRDNLAANGAGGAIHLSNGQEAFSSALIERTLFLDNTSGGDGAALFSFHLPTLSINDVLFEGNQTLVAVDGGSRGGAAHLRASASQPGSSVTFFERTSFLSNSAGLDGGALNVDGPATVSLRNSTFHDNRVATQGVAALGADNDAAVVLFFTTFYDNGDGVLGDRILLARDNASVNLDHSIVANSWATTSNCLAQSGGTISSAGFNLDSGSGCAGGAQDLTDADPQLGGLSTSPVSGAPFDQAILVPDGNSPAVEAGDTTCPGPLLSSTSVDQRGEPRPVVPPSRGLNPRCDIGAIEFQQADEPIIFSDRFEP